MTKLSSPSLWKTTCRAGLACGLIVVAWFASPAIAYLIVMSLPQLSEGVTVNLHVYGSARWLGAATVVALIWRVHGSERGLPVFSVTFYFLMILCLLLLLNLLGDFQLWAKEKATLWPLQTSIISSDGALRIPGFLVFPWTSLPDNTLRFPYAIDEIIFPFLLGFAGYLSMVLVGTVLIRQVLHRFFGRSAASVSWPTLPVDHMALALCALSLALNWHVIIGFPFGSPNILSLGIVLLIPIMLATAAISWLIAKGLLAMSRR